MGPIAFAGSGRITAVHGLAAQALGQPVSLVASRQPAKADERAGQLGARRCTYDELPGGAGLVVVATPPARHTLDARRALDGGADVLVEKPLCTTLADADELVARTEAGGPRLVYAENLLFAPAVRRAVAIAATLGPLQNLEVRALQGRPDWGDFLDAGWGGGVLFDLGVHPIAVALALAAPARPVGVAARLDGAADIDVDEHATLELHFDTGLVGRVEASWRTPTSVWDLQAASDTGVVRAELLPTPSLEHNGAEITLAADNPDPGVAQLARYGYLAQLERALDPDAHPDVGPVDAAVGRAVLDVVCAAYWSAGAGGERVALPFEGPRDRTPLELWRRD